jgi:hypothetical protein
MADKDLKNALDAMLGGSAADDNAKAKLALLKQINRFLEDSADAPEQTRPDSAKNAPPKVVRDSFTLPEDDYNIMLNMQDRAMDFRLRVTKGEVLRAGLHALKKMSDEEFLTCLKGVEKLKPGRRKDS